MKLPIGTHFVHGEAKGELERGVSKRQLALAYGLRRSWYRDELLKPPFKPIGLQEDPDLDNSIVDIRKRVVLVPQLASCPMLPWSAKLVESVHPVNWCLSSQTSIDKKQLTYIFKGLDVHRFAKSEGKRRCETGGQLRALRQKLASEGQYVEMRDRELHVYPTLNLDNPHLYEELVLYRKVANRVGLRIHETSEQKEEREARAWNEYVAVLEQEQNEDLDLPDHNGHFWSTFADAVLDDVVDGKDEAPCCA
jgi:hypothetical protein